MEGNPEENHTRVLKREGKPPEMVVKVVVVKEQKNASSLTST